MLALLKASRSLNFSEKGFFSGRWKAETFTAAPSWRAILSQAIGSGER